jgi:hypothetical protein
MKVRQYKLSMVQKLMESFNVDAALLARFLVFGTTTLDVMTEFGNVDKQLYSVKADLGIEQGWQEDLENREGNRVDVVGHHKALAMMLQDQVEDIEETLTMLPSVDPLDTWISPSPQVIPPTIWRLLCTSIQGGTRP